MVSPWIIEVGMGLEKQGFPANIWVLSGCEETHVALATSPTAAASFVWWLTRLGLRHLQVGFRLECLDEKLFGVMKFGELSIWLFLHFYISAANAVTAMKLEHLTRVHLMKNFMGDPWSWRREDIKRTSKHSPALRNWPSEAGTEAKIMRTLMCKWV